MLSITEIETFSGFLELRENWNKILARSKDNNIFLTWEYLSTFWKHFGKYAKLRILCVKDREEIIAIAPLRQLRYEFANLLGYEVIEPLGYRGLMPEGCDYTGLLLGEREEECLNLYLKYLEEQSDWDFIYMYDVPETSAIPNLLQRTTNLTTKFEVTKGIICPYIPLPNSIDVLFKGFTKKFRNNLRRCMRNLERDYAKVQVKKYDGVGSIKDAMKILFKLNQKRWKSRGTLGTFKTQEICNFYMDVARVFAQKNWLALYFLTIKDEPIAGLYCFEYNQKMLAAIIGFDPTYSRYSIGNLLFLKVIEKCIERKLTEFDFMKGDEPYKFGWTKMFRRNLNIKFVNKKPTSRFYNWGIKTLKRAKIDKTLEKLQIFSLKRGML